MQKHLAQRYRHFQVEDAFDRHDQLALDREFDEYIARRFAELSQQR